MPNNETKKEFKSIVDGMLYHCMELTNFMGNNIRDPYFETEQGKRMRNYAMEICAKHAMVCMEFLMERPGDTDGDKPIKPMDIEQMLKDML